MRSPDSDGTGEASGGEALAEGFGTFLDGAGGPDDTDGTDDGTGFETGFGAGATRDDADTGGLEGLDGAGAPTNAYDAEPDEVPSEDDYDYTGDGHVDGQDFHEAITSLFDFEVEPEPAPAHHDDGAVDLF